MALSKNQNEIVPIKCRAFQAGLAILVALTLLVTACAPSSLGGWITFNSKRDGNVAIYKMRADGSEVTRLSQNEADDLFPSWGP